MSTPLAVWRTWEGRIIDEKFPLRQWLGGSGHSAVFLTERTGGEPDKAAIKLISADNLDEEAQLLRWAAAAKFSHPHVVRLFEHGSCIIDGTRLLYVVMEFADEDLGQILPVRALSASEASEMLQPAVEALSSLHRAGFAHGSIKPSNIMAADNQLKLSADSLGRIGEPGAARRASPYDAPEVEATGATPAADVWSLGATLVAVLTQREPVLKNGGREPIAVANTIPQPHREIARECLQEEAQRCSAEDILRQLRPAVIAGETHVEASKPQEGSMRWGVVMIVVAAILIFAWLAAKVRSRPVAAPAAETRTVAPVADAPVTTSPAPLSAAEKPVQEAATARGSVRQQVMPEVSRGAENTITGHVKVGVQVAVDASGDVTQAKLVSAGPSKYFANKALDASRRWKFNAPRMDGQAASSEWLLKFQFGRGSVQVFPAETK